MSTESDNLYQTPISDIKASHPIQEEIHSKLGVASFAISVLTGFLLLALLFYAGYIETTSPGGIDESSNIAIIIGFGFICSLGILLVSLGLGIAGLFQKERKKVFAALGTVFSSLIILSAIGIIILGLSEA